MLLFRGDLVRFSSNNRGTWGTGFEYNLSMQVTVDIMTCWKRGVFSRGYVPSVILERSEDIGKWPCVIEVVLVEISGSWVAQESTR